MNPSPELQAALDAAAEAAVIARSMYQHNIEVRIKADKSPVTEADVRCETAIREILEKRFPTYGFLGEETVARGLDAENLWLGRSHRRHQGVSCASTTMFSTQIALMRRGEIVLGVSSAPVYGELAFAERGCGAFLNGKAIAVSQIAEVEDAALSSGNLKTLAAGGNWNRYGGLVARLSRIRGYGDFLHYHLLGGGQDRRGDRIRRGISWTLPPASPSCRRQAVISPISRGPPITLQSKSVLATNGRLHEQVLAALR